MRKIITLMFTISLVLSLGGCSWVKKVGNKIKGDGSAQTEQTADSANDENGSEKPAAKTASTASTASRVRCSTKKTYEKDTPCWHWKRGARIGKPGYGDSKTPEATK